jgi:prevent-host-death family protein
MCEKVLAGVVSRDYIVGMKEKKPMVYPKSPRSEPAVLRDSAVLAGERVVTVRDAKAHLSALLEWVAAGHALTITSDGKPKARLIAVKAGESRKVFRGAAKHLARMPRWSGGPTAEEIIREDRDGRGW